MADIPTFFDLNKQGRLKQTCKNNRTLILTMLKENKALTFGEISRRSGVNRNTAFRLVKIFVMSGLAKRILKATHESRTDYKYGLTEAGLMYALSISYGECEPIGVSSKETLQKLFQPNPDQNALTTFGCYVLLNALDRGLVDYVMRLLVKTTLVTEKAALANGRVKNWMEIAISCAESFKNESAIIHDCVKSALARLSEKERDSVLAYLKSNIVEKMFEAAQGLNELSNDKIGESEILQLAESSQKDSEGLFLPFSCDKCGYMKLQTRFQIVEIVFYSFSRLVRCPACNQLVRLTNGEAEAASMMARPNVCTPSSSLGEEP